MGKLKQGISHIKLVIKCLLGMNATSKSFFYFTKIHILHVCEPGIEI